ncbi:MAG: hypothetical protein BWY70_00993 [Bacteroidetes bacterium ADurb.Bin408]|nr:MAG: hypothetical protein BWY70_00993 [Bacteroidetes bacterium ADurb.Bin408]
MLVEIASSNFDTIIIIGNVFVRYAIAIISRVKTDQCILVTLKTQAGREGSFNIIEIGKSIQQQLFRYFCGANQRIGIVVLNVCLKISAQTAFLVIFLSCCKQRQTKDKPEIRGINIFKPH